MEGAEPIKLSNENKSLKPSRENNPLNSFVKVKPKFVREFKPFVKSSVTSFPIVSLMFLTLSRKELPKD